MRKVKNTYTPEKVSVKEYFGIFKGIKIPWLFFVMILVCTIEIGRASCRERV